MTRSALVQLQQGNRVRHELLALNGWKTFRQNNISTFVRRCTKCWRGSTECRGSQRRSSSGIRGRFGAWKRGRKLTVRFHIFTIRCKGSPSRSIICELSASSQTSTLTSRWTGGTRSSIRCTTRSSRYEKFIYIVSRYDDWRQSVAKRVVWKSTRDLSEIDRSIERQCGEKKSSIDRVRLINSGEIRIVWLQVLCEVETAILNLGLQVPTAHTAKIVTESSNWAKEGDLTLMLIQDWGVIRLYQTFLNAWTKAFRDATAPGPGTCDPNRPNPGAKKNINKASGPKGKRIAKIKKQKRPVRKHSQGAGQNSSLPQGPKKGIPRKNRLLRNKQKKLARMWWNSSHKVSLRFYQIYSIDCVLNGRLTGNLFHLVNSLSLSLSLSLSFYYCDWNIFIAVRSHTSINFNGI